jgi:hypothetical protein
MAVRVASLWLLKSAGLPEPAINQFDPREVIHVANYGISGGTQAG